MAATNICLCIFEIYVSYDMYVYAGHIYRWGGLYVNVHALDSIEDMAATNICLHIFDICTSIYV